jgi:tRNA1(Val) A37 N6-methylase TrmN6
VLLAAAIPDGAGRPLRVLDVGAGVGTAGLCVARRVPEAEVLLLEKEQALARIAADNVERNGFSARVRVAEGEVGLAASALSALGLTEESFDRVMANPPFHGLDAGTPAPHALKVGAHAMPEAELEAWARFMARMAAPGATVTLVHKAEALARLLGVLERRFGAVKVLPVQPRVDAPAHRIIVEATKGSRALPMLLPPFVLHEADGAFTPAAQAILRTGAPLPMLAKA